MHTRYIPRAEQRQSGKSGILSIIDNHDDVESRKQALKYIGTCADEFFQNNNATFIVVLGTQKISYNRIIYLHLSECIKT